MLSFSCTILATWEGVLMYVTLVYSAVYQMLMMRIQFVRHWFYKV